jgi:hypothetical protein
LIVVESEAWVNRAWYYRCSGVSRRDFNVAVGFIIVSEWRCEVGGGGILVINGNLNTGFLVEERLHTFKSNLGLNERESKRYPWSLEELRDTIR